MLRNEKPRQGIKGNEPTGGSLSGRVGRKSEMRRTSVAGARSVDIGPASALESSVRDVARDPRGRGKNALVLLSRAVTSFLPTTTHAEKERKRKRERVTLWEQNRQRWRTKMGERNHRCESRRTSSVCMCVFAFVTFSPSMLQKGEREREERSVLPPGTTNSLSVGS